MVQSVFVSTLVNIGLEFGKFKTYQTIHKGDIFFSSIRKYMAYKVKISKFLVLFK